MKDSKNEKYRLTEFQKKVYRAILKIPLGEVRSYSWVAKKIGKPNCSRAIGNALNKNPFAPLVPCHRVVNSNGKLGGYRLGIKKKISLLSKEKYIREAIWK